MISAETIAELEARRLLYVLGVRERTDKLVRELVLDDPTPFVPFVLMKPRREVDYEAKAVTLAGRRYIVCRNLDEMHKDAANRATIVAALERQLKKGDKSLVGNKGYRRFLKNPEGDGFAIDREESRILNKSSTACSCCRPMRSSRRSRRCSSTNNSGQWSGHSEELEEDRPPRRSRRRRPRLLARRDRRPQLAHRHRGQQDGKRFPCCARRHAPEPPSRSPPSASPCRRRSVRSQPPDPRKSSVL